MRMIQINSQKFEAWNLRKFSIYNYQFSMNFQFSNFQKFDNWDLELD